MRGALILPWCSAPERLPAARREQCRSGGRFRPDATAGEKPCGEQSVRPRLVAEPPPVHAEVGHAVGCDVTPAVRGGQQQGPVPMGERQVVSSRAGSAAGGCAEDGAPRRWHPAATGLNVGVSGV
jgi:hypothetical protein